MRVLKLPSIPMALVLLAGALAAAGIVAIGPLGRGQSTYADTKISEMPTTCDDFNNLPPCGPGMLVCVKCDVSTGTKLTVCPKEGEGWIVTDWQDCGIQELGMCVNNVCVEVTPMPGSPCDGFSLVTRQP